MCVCLYVCVSVCYQTGRRMSLARRLKGTVYISDHEFHFPENLTKFDGSQAATASS